jgi:hypothetical protein
MQRSLGMDCLCGACAVSLIRPLSQGVQQQFHLGDERASSPTRHERLAAGDWWRTAAPAILARDSGLPADTGEVPIHYAALHHEQAVGTRRQRA